jgi:hypothetical protein
MDNYRIRGLIILVLLINTILQELTAMSKYVLLGLSHIQTGNRIIKLPKSGVVWLSYARTHSLFATYNPGGTFPISNPNFKS